MIFVDTNILVFATQTTSPRYQRARDALARAMPLAISAQVLREFYAVTTHPRFAPHPVEPVRFAADIKRFSANFTILPESDASFERLMILIDRHRIVGRAVHDANIAATMLANGVTRILTDNAADFRRYAPEIEIVGLA